MCSACAVHVQCMCSAYTEHTQSMCGAQRLKVQSLQGLKGLQGPRCSLSRDTERGEETGPRVRGETARCESFGASYELDPHLHPYLHPHLHPYLHPHLHPHLRPYLHPYLHPHLRPQGALKCEVRVLLLQRICGAQPLEMRHQRHLPRCYFGGDGAGDSRLARLRGGDCGGALGRQWR